MEKTDTREFEIDFKKIYHKMRPKLFLVVIVTLVVGIMAGVITHFFFTPQYSSTVKMYVYSNSDRVTANSTITSGEITASQDLVNTYIYILRSDTVLDAVAKDLNLDITASQLRGIVKASKATDTVAFEVTVTCASPKWSAQIANSIAKIAPDEIVRVVKAGGVEIIDYAKTPTKPSSPNMKRNVLIGALVGFIVSFGSLLIYCLFDTSITSVKDLEREFEFPVLGTIPKLENIREKDKLSEDELKKSGDFLDLPKPSEDVLKNIKAMKGDEQ